MVLINQTETSEMINHQTETGEMINHKTETGENTLINQTETGENTLINQTETGEMILNTRRKLVKRTKQGHILMARDEMHD